jgi:hypothetical protein
VLLEEVVVPSSRGCIWFLRTTSSQDSRGLRPELHGYTQHSSVAMIFRAPRMTAASNRLMVHDDGRFSQYLAAGAYVYTMYRSSDVNVSMSGSCTIL